MAGVSPERVCAQIDGDFVVFIIGMRINKIWKVHKWLPVFFGMPRMLKELTGNLTAACSACSRRSCCLSRGQSLIHFSG